MQAKRTAFRESEITQVQKSQSSTEKDTKKSECHDIPAWQERAGLGEGWQQRKGSMVWSFIKGFTS